MTDMLHPARCWQATTVRDGVDGKWGLESLFHKYGVDFFMCGHEHDYERMYDVAPSANSAEPWLSGKTTQTTTDMPATTCALGLPRTDAARRDPRHTATLLRWRTLPIPSHHCASPVGAGTS
jgi:hypothetical protein